jgi:hypothetical protein
MRKLTKTKEIKMKKLNTEKLNKIAKLNNADIEYIEAVFETGIKHNIAVAKVKKTAYTIGLLDEVLNLAFSKTDKQTIKTECEELPRPLTEI